MVSKPDPAPTWTLDQLALLGDSRLPPEARVIGLIQSLQESDGEGFAPLGYPAIRGVLPMVSDEKIQVALRLLASVGWVERKAGGRGHPDRFRLLGAAPGPTYPPIRSGLSQHLSDSCGLTGQLSALRCGLSQHLTARSSSGIVVVEEGGDARARDARHELDPRVDAVMDEPGPKGTPLLAGCRDSLRDYLRERVPTDRQHAYVRSVQSWLQGGSGTPKRLLEVSDPAALIGKAINDLGTEDETTFKTARGQVGIVATLRVKVEHLVREELRTRENVNGARRGESTGAAGATRAEPGGRQGHQPAFPEESRSA